MSLDGMYYIRGKVDARESAHLNSNPYSRSDSNSPSRDPKPPSPSKKTPLSNLKSDDASIVTSSTSTSTSSTMAILRKKMHRSKKDKKDNKKYNKLDDTDAIAADDAMKEKEKKRVSSIRREQHFFGVMDLLG